MTPDPVINEAGGGAPVPTPERYPVLAPAPLITGSDVAHREGP